MKTSTTILASSLIALASLAAGSASAESLGRNYPVLPQAATTLTRAQVQAETVQAFHNGELAAFRNNKNYPLIRDSAPAKTRAEVLGELVQARKDNSIPKFHS